MIRRGTLLLVLVYAGCKGHKSCGDGSVAVPSDDPDGGVTCIAAPDEEGGTTDGPHADASHLPPDGPSQFCGDGLCGSNESCETCPTDCGTCGPVCGDGVCSTGETCSSCPTDCGSCLPDAAIDGPPGQCPGFDIITSTRVGDSTVGRVNTNVGRSCGGTDTAPDHWYRFTATASGTCHASTSALSTGYDSVVYVRNGCLGTTELGCNDDASGVGPSTATWTATAGIDYYIIVDGYNGTSGTYTLDVGCP